MKIFFCALILLLGQATFAQQAPAQEFAVYLLPDNIKPAQLKKLDLQKLRPSGKPLIGTADIRYYRKETHEFRVGSSAAARLKQINNRGGAKSFAVFVGGNAIYAGAFWKSTLSQSFDGVVIDTYKTFGQSPISSNNDFPVLTLETGYPSTGFFRDTDRRADSRIFEALENAGVLYDELELVVKCRDIFGTGKRRPSFIFTFEVVEVAKGDFQDKEIQLELYDGQLLDEVGSVDGLFIGNGRNFDRDREIVLKYLKQAGRAKPELLFRGVRKK